MSELHVALPLDLSRKLRSIAKRRGDLATVMVNAALRRLVEEDQMDALLGDKAAAGQAGGHGRQPVEGVPDGLTMLQAGVLYVLGRHVDDGGVFRYPAIKIGVFIGVGLNSHVATIPGRLKELGLTERLARPDGSHLGWVLTDKGRAVWRELSGERG